MDAIVCRGDRPYSMPARNHSRITMNKNEEKANHIVNYFMRRGATVDIDSYKFVLSHFEEDPKEKEGEETL